MFPHVRIVGALMILNGVLTSLLGLTVAFWAPATFALESLGFIHPAAGPKLVGKGVRGLLCCLSTWLGLPVLATGALNVIAGAHARKFTNRILVLVALFFNAFALPTVYGAPTCLAVFIYGVLVFFHADVVRAFDPGNRGGPAAETPRRFVSRRYRVWEDEEDNES